MRLSTSLVLASVTPLVSQLVTAAPLASDIRKRANTAGPHFVAYVSLEVYMQNVVFYHDSDSFFCSGMVSCAIRGPYVRLDNMLKCL